MAGPIFNSYDVMYTLSGTCTGSITNVILTGGIGPYSLNWKGRTGNGWSSGSINYTANTLDILNLCVGQYSGTVTSTITNSASTEIIEIVELPLVTLSATVIDDTCITNTSNYCKIRLDKFTHTQPEVTYNLYRDGLLHETKHFTGTGNHPYIFDNLPPASYSLTAHDGTIYQYQQLAITGCSTNPSSTGTMSAATIVENWARVCEMTNWSLYLHGPAASYPTGFFPTSTFFTNFNGGDGGWYITDGIVTTTSDGSTDTDTKTGDTDFTVDSDLPPTEDTLIIPPSEESVVEDYSEFARHFWFYTGNTDMRLTDASKQWYSPPPLSEQASYEGEDLGPSTVLPTLANAGTFYWSTKIEKWVVLFYTAQGGGAGVQWVTYAPTKDQGALGNPTSNEDLTSNTQWSCSPITANQFTTSGTSSIVVSASAKAGDLGVGNCMIECATNSGIVNGFISNCSYLNYVHEITVGSTAVDNDTIGVFLAWFRDINGDFGPKGTSHNISLAVGNQNGLSQPQLKIQFNSSNSTNAFSSLNNEEPWTSTYSTNVLTRPSPYSTAGASIFNTHGNIRLRITRSGLQGELFKIEATDTMGLTTGTQTNATKNVGDANPYNSDYDIHFSLLDPLTWSASTTSAPSFASGCELERYLGSQKYGYFTSSQANSQFYDISFSGYQSNFILVPWREGVSESLKFELYNKNVANIDHTDTAYDDWYNSFGDANPGRPEIPVIRPTLKVELQTYKEPITKVVGANKISTPPLKYLLYYCDEITEVPLELTWTTETLEMRNNKAFGKYSIFPYVPELEVFVPQPLVTRIFDNLTGFITAATETYVVGTDNVDIGYFPCQDCWEYCIKPSTIIKDKLSDITYSGTKFVKVSGSTNTWFDTLDLNANPNYEYGIYDRKKDSYLILVNKPEKTQIEITGLNYDGDGECKLYNQRVVAISSTTSNTGAVVTSGVTTVIPFDFPSDGNVQVVVNGVTLYRATDLTFSDGDFYSTKDTVTFQTGTLRGNDLINMFYIPNPGNKTNYVQYITAPSVITSATTPIYSYNIYYRVELDFEPLGDIGLVFNGVILYQGKDFKLVGAQTIEITAINSPGGIVGNDRLMLFYFTSLTTQGVATTRNPSVEVMQVTNVRTNEEVELYVFNASGTTVYTQKHILKRGTTSGAQKLTFSITVPGPGHYYYDVVARRHYPLISKNIITTQERTRRIGFYMPSSVYYFTARWKPSDTEKITGPII